MNARIEEILQKNTAAEVKILPIIKPSAIPTNNPCIKTEDYCFFYTFDSRSMFFPRVSSEPIISLPDEIKDLSIVRRERINYCFTLSSKNRLDYCVFDINALEKKICVTRNVLQMVASNDKLYYVFKKDNHFFINEIIFDGKKWLGRNVLINIEGEELKLYKGSNSFFYIKDRRLYNSKGENLNIIADFMYEHGESITIGEDLEDSYLFTVYDSNMLAITQVNIKKDATQLNMKECMNIPESESSCSKDEFLAAPSKFRSMDSCIRCSKDVLVLLIGRIFHIFRINGNSLEFQESLEAEYSILGFDILFIPNKIQIHVLANNTNNKENISASDRESINISYNGIKEDHDNSNSRAENKVENDTSMNALSTAQTSKENTEGLNMLNKVIDNINNSETYSSFDCFNPLAKSLEPSESPEKVGIKIRPRNKLLDEVKAALNRRKPSELFLAENPNADETKPDGKKSEHLDNNSQTTTESIKEDRFKNYIAENELSKSPQKSNATKTQESPIYSNSVPVSPVKNTKALETLKNSEHKNNVAKEDSCIVKENTGGLKECISIIKEHSEEPLKASLQFLEEHRKISLEIHKSTIMAIESAISRSNGLESLIKDLVMKSLVPVVEASMNEMRVQIIGELRKMHVSHAEEGASKLAVVKRLINANKVTQAILEIIKGEDSELESFYALIGQNLLESVDSNILAQLFMKIYNAFKRNGREPHLRMMVEILTDLEVNDLSIDNLQALSVLLRYLREMKDIDKDLLFLVDFSIKKIKKRTKANK
jgi:hypothetical protein